MLSMANSLEGIKKFEDKNKSNNRELKLPVRIVLKCVYF